MDGVERVLWHRLPYPLCILQRHVCWHLRDTATNHRLADHVLPRQRDLELWGLDGVERYLRHRLSYSHRIV